MFFQIKCPEASVVAHAGQNRAAGVADASSSSQQLLFKLFASVNIKHIANIVRVFMTLILAVSDLNLFRVLFSGTEQIML